jgi:hypothetical protein
MRRRWIQKNGELIEVPADYVQAPSGPMIMPDIQPYRSQLDGSVVTSRSRHRELLRAHGCIEVGNETRYLQPKAPSAPAGLKRRLIEVFNSKT